MNTGSYYCTYEFSYDGKIYTAKKQVFTTSVKHIGDRAEIRINPDKPSECEDTYGLVVFSVGGGFMLILSVVLIAFYKLVKKRGWNAV